MNIRDPYALPLPSTRKIILNSRDKKDGLKIIVLDWDSAVLFPALYTSGKLVNFSVPLLPIYKARITFS